MKKIARHAFDIELVRELADTQLHMMQLSLENMHRIQPNIFSLSFDGPESAGYQIALNPEHPEVCRGMQLGAKACAAMFQAASMTEGTLHVELDGYSAILPATGPHSRANIGAWHGGYTAAIICRDKASLDILCDTPQDVLEASSSRGMPHDYLEAKLRRALWRDHDAVPDLLMATLEATDPDFLAQQPGIPSSIVRYILRINVPVLELLADVIDRDEDAFNRKLADYLRTYKKYAGAKSRSHHSGSLYCMAATGVACLAHAAGMQIDVESDYIPRRLYEGACTVDPTTENGIRDDTQE